MRIKYLLPTIVLLFAAACSDASTTAPVTPDPVSTVLLKDITIPNLPSPFYHFEYDATGRIAVASYASELLIYDLRYSSGRLSEMQNNILVNRDRLVYTYDDAGRVSQVNYVDGTGVTFTRVHFAYDGRTLIGLQRERTSQGRFVVDKTMSMSYDADGNLSELTEHRPAIAGVQGESSTVDRFEQYDTGVNVDGFSLIHDEFFDHLILLPQVQLQKNNPRLETLTGDGVNYHVDYTYSYDERNRPLAKNGDLVILNGANVGQHFQTHSFFSYY
jgi:hypothetical protein